jgi:hypothetical protein
MRRRGRPKARALGEASSARFGGSNCAHARERELDLHAALAAQELVPFVDDDDGEVREALAPVGAREHQRQALGRGDERCGKAAILAGAGRRRRVAGAHVDGPVGLERGGGALHRQSRVRRERT